MKTFKPKNYTPSSPVPFTNNLPVQSKNPFDVKIIGLGGVGTVTKNFFVYETEKDIIVLDCGIGFPDETNLGIDFVLPDVSYLMQPDKLKKVRAFLITHAHEDHMGGLPYILPKISVPVYTGKLTAGFIKGKLEQTKGGNRFQINTVEEGTIYTFGDFRAEFVHITHSVPDSKGIVLKVKGYTIYHSPDFKFDWTPVDGRASDATRIAQIAGEDNGVFLLLSDCLRSEKKGYTLSEVKIQDSFDKVISKTKGNVYITTASSNISRIEQAVKSAEKFNKRVALVGRSIDRNITIAQNLGFINIPRKMLVKPEAIQHHKNDLVVIVAGSQAQPESALSMAVTGEHRKVTLAAGDAVVFSADPIPGNETAVDKMINSLTAMGVEVYYSSILEDLHVSGHGAEMDLKLMMALTKAKNVLPIGGSLRQMKQYGRIATTMGYQDSNIIIPKPAQEVILFNQKISLGKVIPAENIFVDSMEAGEIDEAILKDRRTLSSDGIVLAILKINHTDGSLYQDPEIITRGFIKIDKDEIIRSSKRSISKVMDNRSLIDSNSLRHRIKDSLERYFFDEYRKRPLVLIFTIEV